MAMAFKTGMAAMTAALALAPRPSGAAGADPLAIDLPKLVARADLSYDTPATRSEEGMPVGNGRMGSLVWTTPSALKLQINRVDVFGVDATTTSFPRADSDYASGCGYVDVSVVDAGDDVFAGASFRQHLAVHEGLMTAQGAGVTARVIAWPQRDVMAIEVEDRRPRPEAVRVHLRMLRYQVQYLARLNAELARQHAVTVQTGEHTATSRLEVREGRILLTQQFRERAFHDASAVAISVIGRPSRARTLNESTLELAAAPGKGRFTILIASAASADARADVDVGSLAIAELAAAEPRGFTTLRAETAAWWRAYWESGFVYLHSAEGQADFVEQSYTYFLYLMGATSRGRYPPRFGGMLWYTNGDMRRWGSQYWFANMNAYYGNLMPANRLSLMEPLFALYGGMLEACARAARQQWGAQGVWIPETTFFGGPEELPEDIAAELRDLLLVRKPWEQRSERFRRYAEAKQRHSSRWNFHGEGRWEGGYWVVPNKGAGAFGHTTHILGVGARLGVLAWQRYLFTMDAAWLKNGAYPLLKGAAELYRTFPNLRRGADGKLHIEHVNNGESSWNTSDTPYELGAMHALFPVAIRASEILGVDPELRGRWQAVLRDLPPLPAGAGRRRGAFGGFVADGEGAIAPIGPEAELKSRFLGYYRLGGFIDPEGIGGPKIFRNRMRLREGPGAIDAEHLGGLAGGLHQSLLASAAETPAGEPLLRLFSQWPQDWDAAFSLRAQGAFVVRTARVGGRVPFVEIRSEAGQPCRLANPWVGLGVTVARDGVSAGELAGDTLSFATRKGEVILLVPKGAAPPRLKLTPGPPRALALGTPGKP
jgi:hypothetical protein